MVKRNPNFAKLQAGYLFPEINRRKSEFLNKNPGVKLISLGIGNTTEHLTPHITDALVEAAKGLGSEKGYTGYGDEQGMTILREKIAKVLYHGKVSPEEVFISDGAKCDCGRIQLLFGNKVKIAVQDPSYPVYVDGSVLAGCTGDHNNSEQKFDGIHYMSCLPENDFFPDLTKIPRDIDVLYFCSPNNPTGATATKDQLKMLVEFAKKNKSIIVYDSAYAEYISDDKLPKSIYEIEGAKEVAIEISSFSKPIGFTGVRLGWSICPTTLKYEDGESVNKDWNRVMTTIFNGASNIVQHGGIAALDDKGLVEMQNTVEYYMENATIIKKGLEDMGIKVFGGDNAPYLWAYFPGEDSWDVFTNILEKAHVVTTPGVGFGAAGQGFVRFSAFGHRRDIEEAVKRLKKNIKS